MKIALYILLFYFPQKLLCQPGIDSLPSKEIILDTLPLYLTDTSALIEGKKNKQIDTAVSLVILDPSKFKFVQVFNRPVNFQYLHFSTKASFSKIAFDGKTKFNNSSLSKNFIFNTRFHDVDFIKTNFLDTVSFFACQFDNASFDNAILYKNVKFTFAIFNRRCNFTRLHLIDSATLDFDGVRCFPDTLDFSNNPKIDKEIDLLRPLNRNYKYLNVNRVTKKERRCLINLFRTDISKFKLDYIHFKLYFPENTNQDEKVTVYENLLDNFKRNKQIRSLELLDIEYQAFKMKSSGKGWIAWLPKLWWNFGYDKQRIIYWTIFFLVLFTSITYFFINFLNTEVYRVEQVPMVYSKKDFRENSFGNRVWRSFIYTAVIFFGVILNFGKIEFEKKLAAAYILIVYLAGLICIGYLANFIIQKS